MLLVNVVASVIAIVGIYRDKRRAGLSASPSPVWRSCSTWPRKRWDCPGLPKDVVGAEQDRLAAGRGCVRGSNTLSGDLEWNATLLNGDLENSIPKLKDEVDGDLFMHGGGEFAYALAEKRLIDQYEVYLNPLVWGRGNVHVLGDRGTVRMALHDVKRFDSGVVLLTYLPAAP